MIDDPNPPTWQALQAGVHRIFVDIGLEAEIEKPMETPRGAVSVDVYAEDPHSIERIRYVVECKHWRKSIPQTVVHSFTTVMHETGANIGLIISRKRLQSGARAYLSHTNIVAMTYTEFQARYLPYWWGRYFCVHLGAAADVLIEYVEPFNSRRARYIAQLPEDAARQYALLYDRYHQFGMTCGFLNFDSVVQRSTDGMPPIHVPPPLTPEDFRDRFNSQFADIVPLTASTFRGLLTELIVALDAITERFHELFGSNIFDRTTQPDRKT